MGERKRDFAIDFIGFSTYSGSIAEASIAIHPDFDLAGATSTLSSKEDGSRVVILIFHRSEKLFGQRGYSLKWEPNNLFEK